MMHNNAFQPGDRCLDMLKSQVSTWMPRPTRVRLQPIGEQRHEEEKSYEFAIHHSYEGKPNVRMCGSCFSSLDEGGKIPDISIKTVDVGQPPTGLLQPNDTQERPLPALTFAERLLVSPLKHNYFLTTVYDKQGKKTIPGHLKGTITSFMSAPPDDVAAAMLENYPMSLQELGNTIYIIFVTASSLEEALEKAKTQMTDMKVDARKVLLWCEHVAREFGKFTWHYLQVTLYP